MQKWEYLFIQNHQLLIPDEGDGYVIEGDERRTYSENGKESNGAKMEIWGVANRKGAEGWEVVSAVQGHHWELVLKRPKTD